MTKGAALYSFWSSFGLDAYAANAVPNDVTFDYLTYTPVFDAWGGSPVSLTVNLWYYGTGEAEINAKAQEISDKIGMGGALLPCDGGCIWLKRGSPFCQSVADSNANVKRRYINVTAEYLTLN